MPRSENWLSPCSWFAYMLIVIAFHDMQANVFALLGVLLHWTAVANPSDFEEFLQAMHDDALILFQMG